MSKSHYYLFLSLMVMTMMVCASTQSNDLSQDAWNRFYTAFAGFIGGNPDGITFMTTPYAFTNVPTTGLFQLYTLCNSVPEWQFSYTGKGDVYGGYTEFVDSLYYEVNTQAYQKAAAQQIVVQNNQNSWSQCIEGLTASWTNFHNSQSSLPPQNQWSYTQWYDQIGKPRCQPQYDLWQSSVSQYNDLLKAALINGYDYVFQAQSGLQNPANYMSVYDGTNTRNVSICTTSPDLQSSYTNWLNGQLNPGSFSVSSLTSTYNKWQFSTESGGDLFFDPISIIAGGSYNRIEIDTSSDEFSMTVSWQGLQQLQFSRGSWYNGAIIQGHMDGPFSSSSAIGKGQVKLWGEDGMLGLVPSTAVVIYQPNIEISLSQSDYQKVKSSWTAESGGCIFIFCYETVNKGSSTSVKFNDNQFSFTLTDTSTIPKAIAIVNNVNTDPDSDLRSASKPLPQPSTSSLSLDLKNFRSLSEKAVEFSVSQNEVTLRGDSSCFSGEIKITSSTAQPVAAAAVPASVAYPLAKVPCNDYNAFPTLTTTQMNCIIQSGLKSDTTSSLAWNFYYKTSSNKDLAHFTTGKAGGISAHFTCRAKSSDSGHHTGAVRTVPSQWLKQGCCNYSDSIKKDMNYIITTVLNCL